MVEEHAIHFELHAKPFRENATYFENKVFLLGQGYGQGWKKRENEWDVSCFEVLTIEDGTMVCLGVLVGIENKLWGDQTETGLDQFMQHLLIVGLSLVISDICFHEAETVFGRIEHGGVHWQGNLAMGEVVVGVFVCVEPLTDRLGLVKSYIVHDHGELICCSRGVVGKREAHVTQKTNESGLGNLSIHDM